MKFNDKLAKFRKENFLTQEELAEKLGVTRQTISKWELGQTVPDKDDLVKMSELFNVTVDELLNEKEDLKKEDKFMDNNENDNRKTIIIIVAIIAVVLVVCVVLYMFVLKGVFSAAKGIIGETTNIIGEKENKTGITGIIDSAKKQMELQLRNGIYEDNYSGIKYLSSAQDAVNQVITDNAKNENKITVKYGDVSATLKSDLENLLLSLNKEKYLITYDYDDAGFIVTMNIKDVETSTDNKGQEMIDKIQKEQEEAQKQQEVRIFNSTYETLYKGMQSQFSTQSVIKKVLSNNLDNERKITVKYGKTTAKETSELTKLISNLKKSNYIISFEYNEDGFINVMNITDVK